MWFGRTGARWQDGGNVILGAWLFISPWVFHHGTGGTFWSFWISGALIFLLALWALSMPAVAWTEWIIGLVAIWVFISPWVLGFTRFNAISWDAWVISALVFLLALWALSLVPRRPPITDPRADQGPGAGPLGTWHSGNLWPRRRRPVNP